MYIDSKHSIIAIDRFIQSTRDSGYKNTPSAVAELVDNALQANAKVVSIQVTASDQTGIARVSVSDNGSGMDAVTLREALRFGGSSRFNNRDGLGRYGMGLPNASLSQALRVRVYSWQPGSDLMSTYLDVEEISSGNMTEVPSPTKASLPTWIRPIVSKSGTVVVWEACDRLDHRKISTVERNLCRVLGQTFRHFLWSGIEITVNGRSVAALDPLFLRNDNIGHPAVLFQDPEVIEVFHDPLNPRSGTGRVTVTFSELPIAHWHTLPNDEKRKRGISNGAGVTIVRGLREVDVGWFFMGSKRRENYDDWWRCEVRFDPDLDEAFGITHTKQQVRPREHLVEALQPLIEGTAKALNARVRQAHVQIKSGATSSSAEVIAEEQERRLKPIPRLSVLFRETTRLNELSRTNPLIRALRKNSDLDRLAYRLVEDDGERSVFFEPILAKNAVLVVLNPKHRFYKHLYQPALESEEGSESPKFARPVQLLLLAAARAEATFTRNDDYAAIQRFRREWSDILDVLLSAKH